MASGHVNRTNRPNTWLHRPACGREESPCQPGAVHTWHKADMATPGDVCLPWVAKQTSASNCRTIAIYEYTPSCNGPGDVKSPRVIVTSPSSRFCPWSTLRPPHCAVRGSGEPI